jgi:glutamate-1-semialdehyde 2,1-aminomutase
LDHPLIFRSMKATGRKQHQFLALELQLCERPLQEYTGFRAALGGAQEYYGVTPDVAVFAKAIANGFPFGAVCGRRDIMAALKPVGTFNGNPGGVAAALATVRELQKPGTYEHLTMLTGMLEDGFRELGKKHGIKVYARHVGSLFIYYFGFDEDVDDLREWLTKADVNFHQKFVQTCEQYGVRLISKRGRAYVSMAHTKEDIIETIKVADHVLKEILAD